MNQQPTKSWKLTLIFKCFFSSSELLIGSFESIWWLFFCPSPLVVPRVIRSHLTRLEIRFAQRLGVTTLLCCSASKLTGDMSKIEFLKLDIKTQYTKKVPTCTLSLFKVSNTKKPSCLLLLNLSDVYKASQTLPAGNKSVAEDHCRQTCHCHVSSNC